MGPAIQTPDVVLSSICEVILKIVLSGYVCLAAGHLHRLSSGAVFTDVGTIDPDGMKMIELPTAIQLPIYLIIFPSQFFISVVPNSQLSAQLYSY